MLDLKVINSVLDQLEEERGIPREKVLEAIETAMATAYKKEYGKRGQIIRASFDINTGKTDFYQVKIVVDDSRVLIIDDEAEDEPIKAKKVGAAPLDATRDDSDESDERIRFNEEHHIFIEDAKKIKKGVKLDDEVVFPLESQGDYGRIAAQTAKQVIIQKIREAEKVSVLEEFGKREGEIIHGTVQRFERGNIYVDLDRAFGVLPYDEQIPGERYRQGERVRALLVSVEETPRGIFLKLSRSNTQFLAKLFELEAPELPNGSIEIKAIAREAGSRSKIAVVSNDDHIDPVGSLVGQRGVRVSTVMSELGGEKIDIIEWSSDYEKFIEDALSPAKVLAVEIDEDERTAHVEVSPDQQSLAIGRGGQNVRLAAKLTGWKIDIKSIEGENVAEDEDTGSKDSENTEESEDTTKESAVEKKVEKTNEKDSSKKDKEVIVEDTEDTDGETEGKKVQEESIDAAQDDTVVSEDKKDSEDVKASSPKEDDSSASVKESKGHKKK
ncbi:transcription termination/antitermination protein NusA [Patescibacteria group bacterium]|nr:transcription termination/antitermination protein NusA [Patescibacteria group bacterium]